MDRSLTIADLDTRSVGFVVSKPGAYIPGLDKGCNESSSTVQRKVSHVVGMTLRCS
jgi:hypothetical protein